MSSQRSTKGHHASDVEDSQEDLNHERGGDGCQGDGEEPPVSNDYSPRHSKHFKLKHVIKASENSVSEVWFCNPNLAISSWKPHSLSKNHPQVLWHLLYIGEYTTLIWTEMKRKQKPFATIPIKFLQTSDCWVILPSPINNLLGNSLLHFKNSLFLILYTYTCFVVMEPVFLTA